MEPVAIGFRVKSGYAIAVALEGAKRSPSPLVRHLVELSDPDIPATRQPYHAGTGAAQTNQGEIARLTAIVLRRAKQSVDAMLGLSQLRDRAALAATLVVGSVIDPAQVGNPHIRAHANEGRLFRTALEQALSDRQVPCGVVVEKRLPQVAEKALGQSRGEIDGQLARFGSVFGSPWRTDEKAAALAAWIAIASQRAAV